jgi:anthranilate 1,2-dioxygenase small subunit
MRVTPELWMQIHDLFEAYGRLLDEDRLEKWVELFAEGCRYEIISRENLEQNLPLSLMLCDNKDMLRDRIFSLRSANIYNIHRDCHVLGPFRAVYDEASTLTATAAYSLFQSNQEGESRLFSVGRYQLELAAGEDGLQILRQTVVVDTGAIPTLLATPI